MFVSGGRLAILLHFFNHAWSQCNSNFYLELKCWLQSFLHARFDRLIVLCTVKTWQTRRCSETFARFLTICTQQQHNKSIYNSATLKKIKYKAAVWTHRSLQDFAVSVKAASNVLHCLITMICVANCVEICGHFFFFTNWLVCLSKW